MTLSTRCLSGAFAICAAAMLALPGFAQNAFAPVARVNDAVVTAYEVEQRVRFLGLLGAPGASRAAALEALIDERLRAQAAARVGLQVTETGLANGLADFAGRANLTPDEFIATLERAGVSRETFENFVAIQLEWRDLIRARYGARVQVSEDDIDRAVAATAQSSGVRVLLSEIIMPAPAPRRAEVLARAEEIAQVTSAEQFSSFARRFSATASRTSGGRLSWTPLSDLPPGLRPLVLALAPGEVTDPIPLPDAIALFQLRDIEETGRPAARYSAIEYATYALSGPSRDQDAARVAARVDVCDDLYGMARGQPEEALERVSRAPAEIPQDIAIELAKLDAGEVSTALTRNDGQTRLVVMMCGRVPDLGTEAEVDREATRDNLRQRRFEGFAKALMDELRADATIEILGQ